MFNPQRLVIEHFVQDILESYREMYGELDIHIGNIAAWTGRIVLENIATSDALYHNVEHTIMVTQVGQSIIRGKHLCEGGIFPQDWLHFTMALLCHDIGYVRGICRADEKTVFATGIGNETIEMPSGGTDVAMTPYHIDRSKLFVRERFSGDLMIDVDAELIASYIELTRFPPPEGEAYKDTKSLPGLLRAADFIGQLGDPNYLRKIPALFYEFEELGTNETFGYKNPGDMRKRYARFYWEVIDDYIQDALYYLRRTQQGQIWVFNLYAHVFEIEHEE
ncbi:MAG: metal-dependent phosphohydrolase [Anaerolineae bacterium]|nr:metal-dependent phosphohydrolase [Anaerolineae bacterium]